MIEVYFRRSAFLNVYQIPGETLTSLMAEQSWEDTALAGVCSGGGGEKKTDVDSLPALLNCLQKGNFSASEFRDWIVTQVGRNGEEIWGGPIADTMVVPEKEFEDWEGWDWSSVCTQLDDYPPVELDEDPMRNVLPRMSGLVAQNPGPFPEDLASCFFLLWAEDFNKSGPSIDIPLTEEEEQGLFINMSAHHVGMTAGIVEAVREICINGKTYQLPTDYPQGESQGWRSSGINLCHPDGRHWVLFADQGWGQKFESSE